MQSSLFKNEGLNMGLKDCNTVTSIRDDQLSLSFLISRGRRKSRRAAVFLCSINNQKLLHAYIITVLMQRSSSPFHGYPDKWKLKGEPEHITKYASLFSDRDTNFNEKNKCNSAFADAATKQLYFCSKLSFCHF